MLSPATHDLARHSGQLSVAEDSHHFTVSLEVRPFDVASLDLWIEDHQLSLFAHEKFRPFSSFAECIRLPNDVDEDSIQADLNNERLEIRFKKERGNACPEF